MPSLSDLVNIQEGDVITADMIRLIGRSLSRRTAGAGVYQDETGDYIHQAGGKGGKSRLVLLRSLELLANDDERDKIMAQQVRYATSPPLEGVVVAFGSEFEVYPLPSHTYGSFNFLRSVLPLVGLLKDETIHPNAFLLYECVLKQGYWLLKPILRMFENVQAVDVDNIDYAGGGGT